jgi:hypothetical protein
MEVENSFLTDLSALYIGNDNSGTANIAAEVIQALQRRDPEWFVESFRQFFAAIPYDLTDRQNEQSWQAIMYVVLRVIGINVGGEVRTHKGRIDLTVETATDAYIIEVKRDSTAKKAIEQIQDRSYTDRFRPSGKPIRRVDGVDSWGVTPDAALAVELTPPQRFYRRLLRAVRVSGSEADVADPRIVAFAAAETDALLRRAAQTDDAFARLEALAELGVDPETALDALTPEKPANSENSEEAETRENSKNSEEAETRENSENSEEAPVSEPTFAPSGRAPYFDPQLDRAVDYLLGTLETETTQNADATPDAAE